MKFNYANLIRGSVFLLALSVLLLNACGGGTASSLPASVRTTSPLANASHVAVGPTITATFSNAMNAESINATNFTLSDGTTTVTGDVSYDSASLTATFTPKDPFPLKYLTNYTATITTGVANMDGNALQSDYSWTFTTVDKAPPPAPSLPNPILEFVRWEEHTSPSNGLEFEYYHYKVANWDAYPKEMFALHSGSSSRTQVDFFDGTGKYVYGFGGLTLEGLQDIWFAVQINTPPPQSVYITMTDQYAKRVFTSNTLAVTLPPIIKQADRAH